ncbi:MAG: lactonase family protein [Planctomycetota bacterium]
MNTRWPYSRNRLVLPGSGRFPLAILLLCYLAIAPNSLFGQSTDIPFFIGTYTGKTSQGIYRSTVGLDDGTLSTPTLVAELTNPSFLALHPKRSVLYAVSETNEGIVVAYAIGNDGKLTELNRSTTDGSGPCYVSTNGDGTLLLVANYGSGSISAIRLEEDGRLSPTRDQVQHTGKSVHARQKGPHAHCIQFDPSGQFIFAVDLGLDEVLTYQLESASMKLVPTDLVYRVAPGSGPRHLAFHPDGKSGYVLNELNCTVESFRWDPEKEILETLKPARTTLPVAFQEGFSGAEILVHPNGEYVYVSNRGHDSISCLDKNLNWIGNTPTAGKTPRNFRISPDGKYLFAENQNSDSIVVFRIDSATGKLQATDHRVQVGSPVCIRFQTSQ